MPIYRNIGRRFFFLPVKRSPPLFLLKFLSEKVCERDRWEEGGGERRRGGGASSSYLSPAAVWRVQEEVKEVWCGNVHCGFKPVLLRTTSLTGTTVDSGRPAAIDSAHPTCFLPDPIVSCWLLHRVYGCCALLLPRCQVDSRPLAAASARIGWDIKKPGVKEESCCWSRAAVLLWVSVCDFYLVSAGESGACAGRAPCRAAETSAVPPVELSPPTTPPPLPAPPRLVSCNLTSSCKQSPQFLHL